LQSNRLSNAAVSAILREFDGGHIAVFDADGLRLVSLPLPSLTARVDQSGTAASWTLYAADGAALASGRAADLKLTDTDGRTSNRLQRAGTVSLTLEVAVE
jgi:hypothetical protein